MPILHLKHHLGTVFSPYPDSIPKCITGSRDAFERAKIAYKIPEDMLRFMWWKLMNNVGVNQASAVMRAPYGVMQHSPQAQAVMEA